MIVQKLLDVLPEPYFAVPGVHLGTVYEVEIGTYRGPEPEGSEFDSENVLLR